MSSFEESRSNLEDSEIEHSQEHVQYSDEESQSHLEVDERSGSFQEHSEDYNTRYQHEFAEEEYGSYVNTEMSSEIDQLITLLRKESTKPPLPPIEQLRARFASQEDLESTTNPLTLSAQEEEELLEQDNKAKTLRESYPASTSPSELNTPKDELIIQHHSLYSPSPDTPKKKFPHPLTPDDSPTSSSTFSSRSQEPIPHLVALQNTCPPKQQVSIHPMERVMESLPSLPQSPITSLSVAQPPSPNISPIHKRNNPSKSPIALPETPPPSEEPKVSPNVHKLLVDVSPTSSFPTASFREPASLSDNSRPSTSASTKQPSVQYKTDAATNTSKQLTHTEQPRPPSRQTKELVNVSLQTETLRDTRQNDNFEEDDVLKMLYARRAKILEEIAFIESQIK